MSCCQKYDKKTLNKLHKVETEMLKDINKICEKYNIKYFALDGTGIGALRHKGFIPWDDDIDLRFLYEDAIKFREYVEKDLSDKYYFIDRYNTKLPITFMKMCKKNTVFQDESAYYLGVEPGIFIDIFPLVYVSDDKKEREKKLKKSWFLFKLGTLAELKKPSISFHGLKANICLFICYVIHYLLKIFGISSKKLFDKGENIAKSKEKTNTIASLNTVRINTSIFNLTDIFPVKKVKFEDTYVFVPSKVEKLLTEYFGNYMELPPVTDRHNHFPKKLIFNTKIRKDGKDGKND